MEDNEGVVVADLFGLFREGRILELAKVIHEAHLLGPDKPARDCFQVDVDDDFGIVTLAFYPRGRQAAENPLRVSLAPAIERKSVCLLAEAAGVSLATMAWHLRRLQAALKPKGTKVDEKEKGIGALREARKDPSFNAMLKKDQAENMGTSVRNLHNWEKALEDEDSAGK